MKKQNYVVILLLFLIVFVLFNYIYKLKKRLPNTEILQINNFSLDNIQDHAIFGSLYNFVENENFKYIITGANLQSEFIRAPLSWAYHASDTRQMKDIHNKYLETKVPIRWDDIKDYIYNLDSKKLYFAINTSNY